MTSLRSTDATIVQRITAGFRARFGTEPTIVVRAPGRVNLIGEHTDYNDGFVLPMAINRAVYIAMRPTGDDQVRLWSENFQEERTFPVANIERESRSWIEYVKAMAWTLENNGFPLTGVEGLVWGDVPLGSGLSSSAALELAAGRMFLAASGAACGAVRLARFAQFAENEWIGVKCGIMDQLVSSAAREGAALLIDCRSLEVTPQRIPDDATFVILDSGTRRELSSSAYNARRSECERAAAFFGKDSLRDVSLAEFQNRVATMDPILARRARHVLTENARIHECIGALASHNVHRFGELMVKSHASLRDDFEVSSDALNTMVDVSLQVDGCLGARMTGAGFGGCAVAMVEKAKVAAFIESVAPRYRAETGHEPDLFASDPQAGAEIMVVG